MSSAATAIHNFCKSLKLTVSAALVENKAKHPPKTRDEYNLLIDAILTELKDRLFLFIPGHRALFFEKNDLVSPAVSKAFPDVPGELREAANCLAIGFYTASVFHCVRAIEIGMRVVAVSLGVSFPFPIEQADWANIIDQMEAKIRAMKDRAKSAEKESDLKFYSETAMQFRYFKDAWRVRVSHARESYDEAQATSVMEHAVTFFELVAARPPLEGV
jgi:hypothetical protein